MAKVVIKILSILLVIFISITNVSAKERIKMLAEINSEFTLSNVDLPSELTFQVLEAQSIPDLLTIPENSTIKLKVINAQRELRWHKAGLILCKLESFKPNDIDIAADVSDKNIYLLVRKYEAINKKEAFILGTEIILAQGASFFAPGVDIGYFFIKGAIQRHKHPNWFKAGVRNAYDNSICWFWLKGKPIQLAENDRVQIKNIKTKKVEKLNLAINKRKERFERQSASRIVRNINKSMLKELDNESDMVDCSTVERIVDSIVIDRSAIAEN